MRVRAVPAVVVGVVLALVTGCGAPTPAPTSSSSAMPGELTVPRSVIELACDAAASAEALSSLFEGDAPAPTDLDRDRGVATFDLAERQAGVQRCTWGHGETSAGFAVLPDAAAAYAESSGWYEINEQYVRRDELGDDSKHECGYGYCFGEVLVDDLWMTVYASRPDLMDELDVEPLFLAFARNAIDAVREAPRREAWQEPAGVFHPVARWCSQGLVTDVGAAIGIVSRPGGGGDGPGAFTFETWDRVGRLQCGFAAESASPRQGWGYLELLAGALWAAPELAGARSPMVDAVYEPVSEAEGGPLLVAVGSAGAELVVEVDGSLLFFYYSGLSREELVSAAPALVDAVRAHPEG